MSRAEVTAEAAEMLQSHAGGYGKGEIPLTSRSPSVSSAERRGPPGEGGGRRFYSQTSDVSPFISGVLPSPGPQLLT